MRSFIRQVYGVEGESGVVTLDIFNTADEEGNMLPPQGKVDYHSRTSLEGYEYQPYCNYLNGECYSISETVSLPESYARKLSPGEIMSQEEMLAKINEILEFVTELYQKVFKEVQ